MKTKKKILIIDDDALVLKSVRNLLLRVGYEVDCAKDGHEALSKIDEEPINLIICDIRMPVQDGVSVMQEIKSNAEKASKAEIPFIFITGYASEETPIDAIKLGARDYILKPFDLDELVKSVEKTYSLIKTIAQRMLMKLLEGLQLRNRLIRKLSYRLWKTYYISKAKRYIGNIKNEESEQSRVNTPALILSSFQHELDFLVLNYIFKGKTLTFIAPHNLPSNGLIKRLQSINNVLHIRNDKSDFRLLREILSTLRDFNRSVVVSPDAAKKYVKELSISPATIIRIAIKASVPIIPVVLKWRTDPNGGGNLNNQCDIFISKQLYISPRFPEFKDVFFKRRGIRKFGKLNEEDLLEIGDRVFSKLKMLK